MRTTYPWLYLVIAVAGTPGCELLGLLDSGDNAADEDDDDDDGAGGLGGLFDTEDDGDETDPPLADTADRTTDPPSDPYFRPENLLVEAGFGANPTSGTVLPVTDPLSDEVIANEMTYYIYSDDWDFTFDDTKEYCAIRIPLDNATARTNVDPTPRLLAVDWNRGEDSAAPCSMNNYNLDPADFPAGYSFFDTFLNVNADQDSTLSDLFVAVTDPTDAAWEEWFNQDVLDEYSFGCVVGIPAGRYSLGGVPVTSIPICTADALSVTAGTIDINSSDEAILITRDDVLSGDDAYFSLLVPDGIVPFFKELN